MIAPYRALPSALALLGTALAALAPALRAQTGDDFPRAGSIPPLRATTRVPIFFPPHPPPLGRALAPGAPQAGRYVAPAEMAAHVNEIFYPPLATRLHLRSLGARQRAELDQYRATKVALQTELRAELDRLRRADPAARAQGLADFSRRQTPRIVELEKTAEHLRLMLTNGEHTWTTYREWHLSDHPKRGYSPLEVAQVMRSYAFFQNGLLPAQRRLLREIALELYLAAESAEKATVAQPHAFFPPEPARVSLPDDAPPEVAAKLAAYQTKKSQLKKELYDAVHRHDGARFGFLNGTLRRLAEKQTPPLAELDRLAEEIRVGLAALPEPGRLMERSPFPPVLHQRIITLGTQFARAQKEAADRLAAVLAATPEVRATYRFEADGLKFVVLPSRGAARGGGAPPADTAKLEHVRHEFAAVAESFGRRLAELINEKDAIVADAGQLLGTNKPEVINQALAAAIRVANARETELAYRDYHAAVFQPGLSPEQRRLLFDWVVEQLALPLPRGELQPTQRSDSW